MVQKTTLKPFFSFLITCLFVVNFGFGQPIFNNTITGTNPGLTNPYTVGQSVNANVTVSGIGRGSGINGDTGNNRYNATSWSTNPTIDFNDYFEFTITPNPGYEIDFGTFFYTNQASPSGPTQVAFRSNVDGYASNIGAPIIGSASIVLTAPAYQNITSPITFRFYGWGASAGTGTFSIDEFTFSGVVSALPCATTVTWNGTWSGVPDSTTEVIIAADYNTSNGGSEISFSACNLTIALEQNCLSPMALMLK
jgi:hypothetical protein